MQRSVDKTREFIVLILYTTCVNLLQTSKIINVVLLFVNIDTCLITRLNKTKKIFYESIIL